MSALTEDALVGIIFHVGFFELFTKALIQNLYTHVFIIFKYVNR